MSLQVWLPLNGDLHNQGLANCPALTISSCEWVNGKIGKCLKIPKVVTNTVTVSELQGLKQFSFSCWVYLDTTLTNSSYSRIFSLGHTSDGENGWIRLETIPTNGEFQIIYNKSASHGSNTATYYGITGGSTAAAENAWVHVTVTNDGDKVSTYFNGELKNSWNTSAIYDNGSLNGQLYLGGSYVNLNDVRIYSHCLSPKEVAEIAKGLCLHYKLEGNRNENGGQENLVPNSNYSNYSATPNSVGASLDSSILWNGMPTLKLSQTGNTSNVYRGFRVNILDKLIKGEKYTMTVYAYTEDKSLLDAGMEVRIYQQRANGATTLYGNISYSLINNNWVKIQNTYTIDPDATNAIVNMQIVKNGTVWFSPVKVEKGSVATPWTPAVTDSISNLLGYNKNVEYDCSGFGNNGISTGSLFSSTETSRYQLGTSFTANSYIEHPALPQFNYASYSFWIKTSNDTTISMVYGQKGNPSGGNLPWLSYNAEGFKAWGYFGANSPNYTRSESGSLAVGTWHHFCYVWSNGTAQWYIDGVTSGNPTTYTGKTYITNGQIGSIGDSYTGTSWNGTPFTGSLSDFRIYATALTADQVKELYEVGGSVAKGDTVWAYEYNE